MTTELTQFAKRPLFQAVIADDLQLVVHGSGGDGNRLSAQTLNGDGELLQTIAVFDGLYGRWVEYVPALIDCAVRLHQRVDAA